LASGTHQVIDIRWQETLNVVARSAVGDIPITAGTASRGLDPAEAGNALSAATADHRAADRRQLLVVSAGLLGLLGGGLLLVGAGFRVASRRRPVANITVGDQESQTAAS
jgi:hypothetical protein